MNTFDGLTIENINHCATEDYSAGVSAVVYYAPESFFKNITLPSQDTDMKNYVSISIDDIVFQNNCGWSNIDVLIDETELKQNLIGAIKNKKSRSSLEFFILGIKAQILGFVEKMKNEDLVFLISIPDGTSILFGNLRNFARISSVDFTSGKRYDDNSGVAVSIISNSTVYFISENLIIEPIDSTPINFIGAEGGFWDITEDY